MAKKNANTVSVMPVQNNPNVRILQIFGLTIEEYPMLKLCVSGIRLSECTARQRSLLRQMKERRLVEIVEYLHLFEGQCWVPSDLGRAFLDAAGPLLSVEIKSDPAKVLQFSSARS